MVTKLGPLCKVKLLKNDGDKLVVRSPEKAGVGGSTPSLRHHHSKGLAGFHRFSPAQDSAQDRSLERLRQQVNLAP
jgi:hypothetical protein